MIKNNGEVVGWRTSQERYGRYWGQREAREMKPAAGKGRAYVSRPEAYEAQVEGEYKGDKAESEAPKPEEPKPE